MNAENQLKAIEANEAAESAIVLDATVDRIAFTKAVKVAASLVDRRPVYPVLGCLLIEASPDDLKVSFLGLDHSLSVPVDGGKGFGAALIPARALTAFLAGATGETVTIKKAAEATDLTLADGSGFRLDCVPMAPRTGVDSYARKLAHDAPNFGLADGVLKHLFALTEPFVSSEETRYYLNGVCLEIEDDGYTLRAVATDGHRMGSRTTPLSAKFKKTVGSTWRYIVPRDAVSFVSKHMAAGEVRAKLNDQVAQFSGSGMVFTTELIEGTFPDWRRVVPDIADAEVVTLDAKDALRFIRSATALRPAKRYGSPAIAITADQGRPVFTVTSPDEGTVRGPILGTAPDTIAKYGASPQADHDGRRLEQVPTTFGLNARYLADVLRALGEKTARVHVKDANSPVRITAEGGETGRHAGDLLILMPMRV